MKRILLAILLFILAPGSLSAHQSGGNEYRFSVEVRATSDTSDQALYLHVTVSGNGVYGSDPAIVSIPNPLMSIGWPTCVGSCGRASLDHTSRQVSAMVYGEYRTNATLVIPLTYSADATLESVFSVYVSAGISYSNYWFDLEGNIADPSQSLTPRLHADQTEIVLKPAEVGSVTLSITSPGPSAVLIPIPDGVAIRDSSACLDPATKEPAVPPLCTLRTRLLQDGNRLIEIELLSGTYILRLDVTRDESVSNADLVVTLAVPQIGGESVTIQVTGP